MHNCKQVKSLTSARPGACGRRCDEYCEKVYSVTLEQSGADGIMIGRGAYGRPWFLNQAIHYLRTGQRLPEPSLAEQYAIVRAHFESMLDHYGAETGVRMARKHLGWYSKGLPASADFRAAVNREPDPQRVRAMLASFFMPALERQAA